MENDYLTSELRAIQIRLDFLTTAVTELKTQNEDRRASIDAVASSIRSENRQCSERCGAGIDALRHDVEKLKTEMALTRWIGVILGGTALTLTTYKILTAEASPDALDKKPALERLILK